MNSPTRKNTWERMAQALWEDDIISEELFWELGDPFWMHEAGDGSEPRLVPIVFAKECQDC